ncbi:MAG: putative extracellular solute-binding protein family 1, partial [Streblomastix strix]
DSGSTPTYFPINLVAGLGLSSINPNPNAYPNNIDGWNYLIVDLLANGISTSIGGFELFYSSNGLSIDSIFFANPLNMKSLGWSIDFENNELLNSAYQYGAAVHDTNTTIIVEEGGNHAIQLGNTNGDGKYWANYINYGRYLGFSVKTSNSAAFYDQFRIIEDVSLERWLKNGSLILANGLVWKGVEASDSYSDIWIDLVASGFTNTVPYYTFYFGGDTVCENVLIDNIRFAIDLIPQFISIDTWGSFEGLEIGSADGKFGSGQFWANNYGSASELVLDGENTVLKLNSGSQYHTQTKGIGEVLILSVKVIEDGELKITGDYGNLEHRYFKAGRVIGVDGQPISIISDDAWHTYAIDWQASGLDLIDIISIGADTGTFLIDNISWAFYGVDILPLYGISSEGFEGGWWSNPATLTDGKFVAVAQGDDYVVRAGLPFLADNWASVTRIALIINIAEGATNLQLEIKNGTEDSLYLRFEDLSDINGYSLSALGTGTHLVYLDLAGNTAIHAYGAYNTIGIQSTGAGFSINTFTFATDTTSLAIRELTQFVTRTLEDTCEKESFMKNGKKWFLGLFSLLFTLILFSCGNDKIEVVIGMWPESTNTQDVGMFNEWKRKFETDYPEYEIIGESFIYTPEVFRIKATSHALPTVYQTWFTEPQMIVDEGAAKDITSITKDLGWYDKMDPSLRDYLTFDDKLYGIPRDGYGLGILINLGLFYDAG